jgi:hypothetical protein
LNKNIIRLQLQTQKTTTVEGNAEKANKPDTTVEGNAEKANKPDEKFNWQGTQAQLVYFIEQLYRARLSFSNNSTRQTQVDGTALHGQGQKPQPKKPCPGKDKQQQQQKRQAQRRRENR